MERFGIDISKWQGDFNITKAKNSGVEFSILKIGGADNGYYKDKRFDSNYTKCEKANLPKGCYFFGHATTIEKAVKEANYWVSLMQGKKFEYPVFYDVEGIMLALSNRALTEIIKKVCEIVESKGYWVGIYAGASTFRSCVFDSELQNYSHWVASWGVEKPKLTYSDVQMWQFGGETNKIRSNKINGQIVDQSYCYVDYPTLIKAKHLNGYATTTTTTLEQIAKEVIAGKWGNGLTRRLKLTKAGYDYKTIQKLVNEILKTK